MDWWIACLPDDGPAELVFRLSFNFGTTPPPPGDSEALGLFLFLFFFDLGPGISFLSFLVGTCGLSSSLLSGSSTVSSTLYPVVWKMCFLSRLWSYNCKSCGVTKWPMSNL